MIGAGLRAHITCLNPKLIDPSFAGRAFDDSLLADLPDSAVSDRVNGTAAVSSPVMWVACTRHHRSSTGAFDSSHSTGRAPHQAKQSSTSLTCSAI